VWAATAPCSPAARNLAHHKVPLAGINQGRLGFMTDIALSEMGESIGRDPGGPPHDR
jgi:NAD kinase